MANILLNKMTIRNFKGIKEFILEADSKTINVSGDNGTGKTTLYDAFLWCLFGKDSTDKTKFDWKPLDKSNQEIHHLETEVEVELLIDGGKKSLTRMVSESWPKVRGQAVAEFKGHNTIYKMDGIQIKQKEYKEYLDQLIGEDTFRMLTNLTYFPETMKWEERRKVLIELAGDVSTENIIKSNPELKPINQLLAERSLEDNVKLTKQSMASINKQIKDIPQRIDEVDRSLPDISKLNAKELKASMVAKQEEINAKRDEISSIKNGASSAKTKEQISNLKLHYAELERDYQETLEVNLDKLIESKRAKQDELSELKRSQDTQNRYLNDVEWNISNKKRDIERLNKETADYRSRYSTIQKDAMDPFDEHVLTCPTCKRDYDESQAIEIQATYQEEAKLFNVQKANQLEGIVKLGNDAKAKVAVIEGEIAELEKELEAPANGTLAEQITAKVKEITDLTESIERERKSLNPFDATEEAAALMKEVVKLISDLDNIELNQVEQIKSLETQISELSQSEYAIRNDLMLFDQCDKQIARRDELIAEEQTLSLEYGKLEQRLFLLEAFVKTRVDLLTDTINSKFKLVKFKLFETAINGGIQEVCEPTVNGANYSTGLNNAARINAGLDIINTLMDHYGKRVPVFIDNSESINEILPIDTQLITLTVSKDKELKVEEI